MKKEGGFAEDKEELPEPPRGDHSSQPTKRGGMDHTWRCWLTLHWALSQVLPSEFLSRDHQRSRTNPHQHPFLNSWKEWVNGSQKSIKDCCDGRAILEWQSGFFLPAILSHLLREQKLWYLMLAQSLSESGVLHLLCQWPSSFFSVEAGADGGVQTNSQDCPCAPGKHSRVRAPWLDLLSVSTQYQPRQLNAAECSGCRNTNSLLRFPSCTICLFTPRLFLPDYLFIVYLFLLIRCLFIYLYFSNSH